jgi:hypothetical protein
MATYDETRSPEQIETDIERTRTQMAETLDTIQKKFSPGQLLDQALNYLDEKQVNENLRRFGTNAGAVVKENPIPVALLGVGLTWLAMSGRNGGRGRQFLSRFGKPFRGIGTSPRMESLHSEHGEIPRAMPHGTGGVEKQGPEGTGLEHVRAGVSEKVSHVREAIGEKTSQVRHSVGETMSSVREKAGEVSHRAQERAVRVGHAVHDQYEHVVQDRPLVLGILGLAIGAALGAAMPRTRMEDEMMGEVSDRLAREARETGRDIMHEGEREATIGGPAAHEGPTEAERSAITAGSSTGEIQRGLKADEPGISTSPLVSTSGTTAGSAISETMSGLTGVAGGEMPGGVPPMGERRGSIRDRRKGFLAETIGAATRMPSAEERRRGMPDRRRSASMSSGTGYDSPRTP